MNTQTAIVRRLLPLALACGLLAALTPAAQAQAANPNDANQPDQSEILSNGCGLLLVAISGSSAQVANVTCQRGFNLRNQTKITREQPGTVVLQQSTAFGPDCTITIRGSNSATASLSVQQNFCSSAGAEITAKIGRASCRERV